MLLLTPFEDSAEAYARKYSLRSKFQWKEEEEFLWNMWKEDKFWDSIWKHTVVKNQTIATNGNTSLRIHLRNVVENKQIIATSVTMLVHNMAILESIWNTLRRKVKQMQPVWFCIYSGRQFENAFESSQCTMQPSIAIGSWNFFESNCLVCAHFWSKWDKIFLTGVKP